MSVDSEPAGEPIELLGALADESRLGAFAALVLGARDTDEVADRAELPVRDAVRTLARLEAAGLAVRSGERWQARPEMLQRAVAAARERPAPLDYSDAARPLCCGPSCQTAGSCKCPRRARNGSSC